jgi:hypothetical protein
MFQFTGKPVLEIVAYRPLDEKPSSKASCPHCGSQRLNDKGTTTTLVGGGTGPDDDWNHTWTSMSCIDCELGFVRETKQGNVWYTKERIRSGPSVVLRGVPSCFEAYEYACSCGGRILQRYLDANMGTPTRIISWSTAPAGGAAKPKEGDEMITTPHFVAFMSCDKCGKDEQCIEEYWQGPRIEPYRTKFISQLKLDWKIEYAIARVNLS